MNFCSIWFRPLSCQKFPEFWFAWFTFWKSKSFEFSRIDPKKFPSHSAPFPKFWKFCLNGKQCYHSINLSNTLNRWLSKWNRYCGQYGLRYVTFFQITKHQALTGRCREVILAVGTRLGGHCAPLWRVGRFREVRIRVNIWTVGYWEMAVFADLQCRFFWCNTLSGPGRRQGLDLENLCIEQRISRLARRISPTCTF